MYPSFIRRAVGAILLVVIGSGVAAATPAVAGPPAADHGHHVHHGANGAIDVNVCADDVSIGVAHCLAHVRTDDNAKQSQPAKPARHANVVPTATVGNNGAYDPAFLQSAYETPSSTNGSGKTVAIVNAYNNPNAESDLAAYRAQWGLPACTTANGCFRKVDQRGGTAYPSTINWGWASEISLDVQMVSATCPLCHILLVEADSATFANLGAAVNEAVALHADVVSNSWGGGEYSSEVQDSATYYNHPGVPIVASSGDSGWGVQFPAASPYVTAVGGTTLTQTTNTGTRNASETAWSGSGSGCSAYIPKPSWQHDTGCAQRTVADVSAVADPATGVWAYDTYSNGGWVIFGGTSAAAPIVASIYALAGTADTSTPPSSYPYAAATPLHDVLSGSNGNCGGTYLCNAIAAYDGPTGLGTPMGITGFAPPATSPAPPPPPTPAPTATVPGAPQSVLAKTANPGVKITWKPPASNGGSAITRYQVWRSTSTGTQTYYASATCTSTSCVFVDTGTSRNVTYFYKVTAVNAIGIGALSNQSSAKAR